MSEPAVRAVGLTKRYRIWTHHPPTNLKERIALLGAHLAPTRAAKAPLREEIWALRDISFEVPQGEILGVLGPNGAGKSTLLAVLARVTEPSGGYAELRGRVSSLLEVGTGFHPELSGRDNVFLNGAVLGMSRRETRRKFDEIVDFAELSEFIDMPVKRYSTGMFMRLAFGVAAHLDPEVLLVDEVLSVGDQAFQEKSFSRIEDITRSGRTVVFVSHDTGALARLCRRGLLITGGRLAYDGPIEETIERYVGTRRALVGGGNLEAAEHDGTGDVRLRSLVVENAAGGPELHIDQPAVARAELQAHRPGLSGLRLDLTISSAVAGALVAFGTPLDAIDDRTTLTCWLEELPLRPGTYFVSATITRAGEIVDRVQNQVELALLAPEGGFEAETHAPVVVRHRWIADVEEAAAGTAARVAGESRKR